MHDDIPLTVGRARRVLTERVVPAIHPEREPARVRFCELPGEPVPFAEAAALEYAPFETGTTWGPAWGTTWFRIDGRIPEAWQGRRVELLVDLGFDVDMTGFQCEGLVHDPDGTPLKSLNPRNQWVLAAERATGAEHVEFLVEAASNPVVLDRHPFLPTEQGDIRTSSPHPLYTLRHADLAVFDETVFELAADLDVLIQLQDELPAGPAGCASCRRSTRRWTSSTCSASARRRRPPGSGCARSSPPRRSRRRTASPPSGTPTSTRPGCGRCARRSARSPGPRRR
nr:hypothetical protein [Pseudonocardia sp. HH130630-07]